MQCYFSRFLSPFRCDVADIVGGGHAVANIANADIAFTIFSVTASLHILQDVGSARSSGAVWGQERGIGMAVKAIWSKAQCVQARWMEWMGCCGRFMCSGWINEPRERDHNRNAEIMHGTKKAKDRHQQWQRGSWGLNLRNNPVLPWIWSNMSEYVNNTVAISSYHCIDTARTMSC